MLKILRKKGVAKKIWWGVAIIIIITFAFFGTASRLNSRPGADFAGKIFNQKISFTKFDNTSREVQMFLLLRFQDKYDQVRRYINLDAETWDRLILLSEANRQRILVRDEEVIAAVESNPLFQREGSFDNGLYNDILQFALRVKARTFEEGIRHNLMIEKLLNAQTSSIAVTDEDVTNEFKKQNQKIQVSYVLIPAAQFISTVTANETESQNYYNEHKDEFVQPPSVNVDYLEVPYPANAKEEEKTAARQKAETVYQQLSNETKWKDVADKNGLAIKTSGFFNADQPNPSLGWSFDVLSAVFQLKPNQMTLPLETTQGYVIIKLVDYKEKFVPEFAEIKDKVSEAVKKIKAKEVAKNKAKDIQPKLLEEINKTKLFDFTAAAKALNQDVNQTPFFTQGQYLPKIGTSLDFQETAFSMQDPKTISEPVEVESGYAIIHVDGRQEADMALLEKQKDSIRTHMIEETRNRVMSQFLIQLRTKANLEDNISKLRGEKA
jgi:peptidyl-prolyl cis-trans isomerase D